MDFISVSRRCLVLTSQNKLEEALQVADQVVQLRPNWSIVNSIQFNCYLQFLSLSHSVVVCPRAINDELGFLIVSDGTWIHLHPSAIADKFVHPPVYSEMLKVNQFSF